MSNIPPLRSTPTGDGGQVSYALLEGKGTPFVVKTPYGVSVTVRFQIQSAVDFYERFRRGRPLLTLDFRGSGLSSPLETELSVELLASDILAVTRQAREPVHLIGVHGAGIPAALVAAEEPDLVRSLVLVDPTLALTGVTPMVSPAMHADRENYAAMVLRSAFDFPPGDNLMQLLPAHLKGFPDSTFLNLERNGPDCRMGDYLPRVEVPVLVISRPAWAQRGGEVASLNRGAQLAMGIGGAWNGTRGDIERELFDAFWARVGGCEVPAAASAPGGPSAALSGREQEVLTRLASGASNSEIAERLSISIRTVERHARNIYTKLGVHNRTQAANWARDHGVA
jgi:DNA-binding CsgD family transcriptional regulator